LSERRGPEQRPPAPWGNFPLAELTVLAGIVMLVIGIVGRNPTALGVGVVLAGLGGLEVAVREHFAGYRSHTTLLAGTVFVLVVGGLFYLAGLILAICLARPGVLAARVSSEKLDVYADCESVGFEIFRTR